MNNVSRFHKRMAFATRLVILCALAAIATAACFVHLPEYEQASSTIPPRPFSPVPASPLTPPASRAPLCPRPGNQWVLIEVIQDDQILPIDALGRIKVCIHQDTLIMITENCLTISYTVESTGGQQYSLGDGTSTMRLCPAPSDTQFSQTSNAIRKTSKYEFEEDRLVLSGDGVRITLLYENPLYMAHGRLAPSVPTPVAAPKGPSRMAIEYARTMDVSYEEALRRLDLQSETGEIQQLVAESEPSYFASWLEHEPEFRLVFSFTTPNGDEIIQKYLQDVEWADMVVTQYSEITLEELHSIQRIVSRAARETGVPYESGLNLITGRVTLFTTHVDELRELLETMEHLEQYMDRVEIKHTEDLSVPATLD